MTQIGENDKIETELCQMGKQDILWDYICTSDALDHRLLEIACGKIKLE